MAKPNNQFTPYTYSRYHGSEHHHKNSPRVNRPKHSKAFSRFLVSLILAVAIVLAGVAYFGHHNKTSANTNLYTPPKTIKSKTTVPAANTQAYDAMEAAVNKVIQANSNITFEVAVTDMNTGGQLNFGGSSPMTAASVSKILTATDFLKEAEQGDQSMAETLDDGNTASYDLQQLIVVSSDSAWTALDNKLTAVQLQNYAQSLGVTSFNYQNNTLSARDTANLMTLLYQGKLLNSSDTELLLSYLAQANYRIYILPAIPSSDTVYHKIGLYNDNVNDATIITNGKQTISLVIFTNGNGAYNWPNRALMMQAITKPILSYYQLN